MNFICTPSIKRIIISSVALWLPPFESDEEQWNGNAVTWEENVKCANFQLHFIAHLHMTNELASEQTIISSFPNRSLEDYLPRQAAVVLLMVVKALFHQPTNNAKERTFSCGECGNVM